MKQLELRSYPRAEISEILSVNLSDSKHFKRNVENKLSKWGYGFDYTTQEVTILRKPETAKERLAEIVYRCFGMDIQVDALQFACFIAAFTDIEGFDQMPWEERSARYFKEYGVCVDARTLRNWCSRLIELRIIDKSVKGVSWKTTIEKGRKSRKPTEPEDQEEIQAYYQRRATINAELYQEALSKGDPPRVAKEKAWADTYKALWEEFHCCYYYCKCFTLNALSEDYQQELWEVYELSQELAAGALGIVEASRKPPTTKEEFDREWFS